MQLRSKKLTSVWVDVGGLRMHTRMTAPRIADAPSVVLIHGLGVSSRYMEPLADRLADEFAVYAVDLPGFGLSDAPRCVFGLEELADALAGWMDAVGIPRAALLANSFGCQVVVELALRHPQRLQRAVLQGPTIDRHARTARQQLARLVWNGFYERKSELLVVLRDYLDCGPRRLLQTFQFALRDPLLHKLPYVSAPTLVVRGTRDMIVSQRWAEEVARRLPCGRLRVIPGGPHTLNYSAPLELSRVVRPFLKAAAAEHSSPPSLPSETLDRFRRM